MWQGRFGAVAMDEDHLAHAVRYVSLNPVRAGLTQRAQDWRWHLDEMYVRINGEMHICGVLWITKARC